MRFALAAYLAAYFFLVAGAGLTLWRSGLIEHLHRGWTVTALGAAIVLGLLLAGLSRR